jgi:hypothetical protein
MGKKREIDNGIRHDLETPEGMLPQPEPEPEVEEQEEPERLSRKECAHRVIAEIDGDTTLNELAEEADALFVAGRGGDEDHSDTDSAAWYVRKVLDELEGLGLVEMSWECVVHPLVPRLGKPSGK